MKVSRLSGATTRILAGGVCGVAASTAFLASRKRLRSLKGKVALITGGSRGLGLELARQLGAEGCKLILVARHEEELENAAAQLRRSSVEVKTVAADVSDQASIRMLHDRALEAFGGVDILVNNAGVISVAPVDSLERSDFEQAMSVMFWGIVNVTMEFLPEFLKSGDADIVNITSIGGKIAVPHLLPYCTAKFAATGFSEGLNVELRGRGVHVLTVTPGLMRTGSAVNAKFKGNADAEYRWFALGAAMPGLSMSMERAAAQIVRSLQRRERELTITGIAQAGVRAFGAFPGLTQWVLEKANDWVLPQPSTRRVEKKGRDLDRNRSSLFHLATGLGRASASTHNED